MNTTKLNTLNNRFESLGHQIEEVENQLEAVTSVSRMGSLQDKLYKLEGKQYKVQLEIEELEGQQKAASIKTAIEGTTMAESRIKPLADILESWSYLSFTHEGEQYHLESNWDEGGYNVSVYPAGIDINQAEPEDEINGGFCTGSAIDAIGMFLPRKQIEP